MNRLLRPLALVMAVLALAACVQEKSESTLNPDGSGKVVIERTLFQPPEHTEKPGPALDASAAEQAREFIKSAHGVEAWKDVSFKGNDDGTIHISATAYFPDLAKLSIGRIPPATWTRDASGSYTLALAPSKPATTRPKLTDAQVAARVAEFKQQYAERQTIMQGLYAKMRLEMNYALPGKVKETSICEKLADNRAGLVFEGRRFLEAVDTLMKDDARIEEMVRGGTTADQNMGELVYGKKGDPQIIVIDVAKPQFDYRAESRAARAAQDDMFKKLNIDPAKLEPQASPDGTP